MFYKKKVSIKENKNKMLWIFSLKIKFDRNFSSIKRKVY